MRWRGQVAHCASIAKIPFVIGGACGGIGKLNHIANATIASNGVTDVDVDLCSALLHHEARKQQAQSEAE